MVRRIDKLSVTLGRILKVHGLEGRLSEYRVLGRWKKAVGTVIARHAQPRSVHGRKLTIIVDSPAWMQQLSMLKPDIVEQVNRSLGREVIRDITLKLGEITASTAPVEAPRIYTSLSREEQTQIETCLQQIHDPDIRETLRRVIEKDFLNKKGKSRCE